MNNQSQIKVVVVGGGFGGLNFVQKLSKDKRFFITLVDRNNYHFFPPLLYQVASSFIELSNISYPFRKLFQGKSNIRFFMGSLENIDIEQNKITTDNGILHYDKLVLAMGTETNYFGMEEIAKQALPMKTIDEATHLRNHLLLQMEEAVRTKNEEKRQALMNIVIAGGGPTGVELSGMLAEMAQHIASKEYPEINVHQSHIYLVDAGPVLLAPMSKTAQQEAYKVLEKLGVKIILNNAVKSYQNNLVELADGTQLPTTTLVWASGVIARNASGIDQKSIGRGKRILVNEWNKVLETENVFAIGDLCLQTSDQKFPNGHPQVAQVAIQQGILLSRNFIKDANGKAIKPFVYNDKGNMAIISKYNAVADLPQFSFKGFFAWMTWLFIHIIPLVGFRNKVKIAFSWFWSFITNDPTLRLIIRRKDRSF